MGQPGEGKEEYEDLVNRQIPQNTEDIATARSYGDLRENFEFKSAKEQQRVLMRRRAEAERDLSRARGTNFENPDTSRLLHSGRVGIISYKAVIGQALLGKRPGENAELPTESETRNVTIVRIDPFTNLDDLREKVHPLSEPATS